MHMKKRLRTNLIQRCAGGGAEYLENSGDIAVDIALRWRSERTDSEDKSRERYDL